MTPIAEHHYDQALAFLMDRNNPIESRDNIVKVLISMAASNREIFGADEEEFIAIKTEIFESVVKYKKSITTSSQDK
jgi:hypothetical protein